VSCTELNSDNTPLSSHPLRDEKPPQRVTIVPENTRTSFCIFPFHRDFPHITPSFIIPHLLSGVSVKSSKRKQLSSGRISWLLDISISVTSTGCSRGYVLLLQLMKAILVSKRRKYFIGID
jgi:hypothetical protein